MTADVERSAVEEIRSSRGTDIYHGHSSGLTEARFRDLCGDQVIWHSVDLGDLFIEGTRKTSRVLLEESRLLRWPDLRGKTVLDIGAFGGWYSFEAERRGAAAVTAIDYYSWAVDWKRLHDWVLAERAAGRQPDVYHPPPHVIDEVGLPGRVAFDTTKAALKSKVDPVLATLEDYSGDQFDVVLFLGVLYHCENPMASIRKAARLTREHLILETLGLYCPGNEDVALWEYFGDASINNDATTWWAPNAKGLADMIRAAGFRRVEITSDRPHATNARRHVRLWAHAWK